MQTFKPLEMVSAFLRVLL